MIRLPKVNIVRINYLPELDFRIGGSFVDPEWVFHDIAAGRWTFQLPNRSYEVGPGDLVLLPPGVLHIVRPLTRGAREHRVVQFELPLVSPELNSAPHAVTTEPALRTIVRAHFSAMLREQNGDQPYRALRQGALMADLLALYLRSARSVVASTASSLPLAANIESALRCVQSNLANRDLEVRELAAAAGLSLSHFRRIFHSYTGMSPKAYILRQRLEHAQSSLLQGLANCSEAADRCGFSSVYAFSKAFRRTFGVSPKKWLTRLEK